MSCEGGGIAASKIPLPYTYTYPYPYPEGPRRTTFDHERRDVYRAAIEFLGFADDIVERLPRGRTHLGDQLQRAATSIPLNIAEGAGEFSVNDKRRFYRMALRSLTECAAILVVCRTLRPAEEATLASGRDLLVRIVSMLTRMAKPSESGTGTGTGCVMKTVGVQQVRDLSGEMSIHPGSYRRGSEGNRTAGAGGTEACLGQAATQRAVT